MLEFIKKIAEEAGEICLRESAGLSGTDPDFKGARDLVTVVDRMVEDHIINEITTHFPEHNIIGEETGTTDHGADYCWIIDPIDGTTSYFHQQPFYSVSIAYQVKGATQAGVVYAPALRQMFSAERDGGAWLNGTTRLTVSPTEIMINAVLATGFACLRAGREPNNLYFLNRVLPQIRDIRRCGSAAIDLAYVAAGKVDGFWEMNLNIYDIAAGVLLVEEAGGVVSDMKGGDDFPQSGIVASNGRITEHLLECLNG
ncbi:MAG: inositol monophosphatase family protein [Desulfopila sp.]|jgi:myo-inositol-1(or 4)-monophosphatase|nr:inositol monophosphatase family protein [Desulfopila sp.]